MTSGAAQHGKHADALRELTARISRLTWTARIVSVLAGLAVAGLIIYLLIGNTPTPSAATRGKSRASGNLVAIGAVGGFLVPLILVRAIFKALLKSRMPRWIVELAKKHDTDEDRLRRMAEAIVQLA